MGNPWIDHVMATKRKHSGKSFKEILKMAKKTYKKSPTVHKKKTHKRKTHKRKTHKRKSHKRKTHKRKRRGKSRGRKRRR